MLTEPIKQIIKKHALEEQPKECCGLIVQKGENYEAFPCKNDSNEPNKFKLNCFDYLKASNMGDIKALYHSHFNSSDFSLFDKQQSKVNKLKYILYFAPENEFKIFDPNIDKLSDYLGLKFIPQIQDCFTLAKLYYKKEFNIPINGYTWHQDCLENGQKLFDNNYIREGFIKVSELKKNDCILFKFRKDFSEHCAIYLGDNLILHQPIEKLSRIDELSRYKKYLNYIVRHKSLF